MSILVAVIHTLFSLYNLALFARILLEMMLGPFHTVVIFLRRITEPLLAPLRRHIPPIQSGGVSWDITPMVAMLILVLVEQILTRLLLSIPL